MAALQVDGGRYTTPYALVRALRAGGIAASVRADADAVRLLTVHGAKGLEAPLVLLLDTDPEAVKSETMGVLVDWPGEHTHPKRFVFVASESKPSACMVDALATEQAARQREELNALYVALTRTQNTLVLSSLEPHAGKEGSWWQRLHAHAQDAQWSHEKAVDDAQGETPSADAEAEAEAEAVYTLKILPNVPVAPVEYAQAAIKKVVAGLDVSASDSLESRMGQAMHRLLEWVVPQAAGNAVQGWSANQLDSVARDFALDAAQATAASHMAQTILQGEGAWAWDTAQLQWHANEVTLAHRGRTLRLDRLVQHRSSGAWWVLDYKSTATPQLHAELCAQLLGYRAAVAQAYPGHTVRAAFLTAQGALIEIHGV